MYVACKVKTCFGLESLLGCLELKLHILTLFRVKWGRGSGDPNFFLLQISFSWVKISFHVEFHLPGFPGSALKGFGGWVVGGGGGLKVRLGPAKLIHFLPRSPPWILKYFLEKYKFIKYSNENRI